MSTTIESTMKDADIAAERMKRALDRFHTLRCPSPLEAERLDFELRRFTRRFRHLTARLDVAACKPQAAA